MANYIMQPYDDALANILMNGVRKPNRTGVDTLFVPGILSRYDISERFPLLTRRKVWPKAIFAELLWVLSGSTNNNHLVALGSNIWTPWVDPDFERRWGYEPGDFGPIYGFQLRHFGGLYSTYLRAKRRNDREALEANGFDQLRYMIDEIKTNPQSRRILFSLWNPADLELMRLPPCHVMFQVLVNHGYLTGILTQRSCDFPIGVPANIQFYSALIYLLASECGLKPAEFVHFTVDSHIYVNQIEAIKQYLDRPAGKSPTLSTNRFFNLLDYKHKLNAVDDIFMLSDYSPAGQIMIPVEV